ncbi:Alkane hydroxylase MAH1 [Linum perenne]
MDTTILLLLFLLSLITVLVLSYYKGGGGIQRIFIDVFRNPCKVHDIVTKSLKCWRGTVGSSDLLFTCDPMNAHHIFSKCHSNFAKSPDFKDKLDVLGNGIITSDGHFGLSQRRILHSLLASPRYELLLATTLRRKIQSGLFPVLDRAESESLELDMQDVFKRFMLDSICTTVLGFDPTSLTVDLLPDLPYTKSYDDIEEAIFYRHLLPDFFWKFQRLVGIGEEKKYREARKIFDEFLYGRIKLKRDNFRKTEEEGIHQFDILTSFMLAAEEEEVNELGGMGKSDEFIRDTAFTLIAAGRDTVSVTLTWLLWLIVSNPNVEEKILQEIRANLGEKENYDFFSEDELSKLVYLHGAMCEALRLYPPLPFERRTAIEEDTLPSGHHVRKKATILFSIYAMGRMEETWGKDWMEFKPERWINSQGNKIVHVQSYKFMAFTTGPRACLGKKISFLYVKQVTSALLYNYKVEVVEGHPVEPMVSIMLFMKYGLKIRVSKRR